MKFPQVEGSLQLARKVAVDQIAYENKSRGVKSVNAHTFCRCNEGVIDDGTVKNPNRSECNVIETIRALKGCEFMAHFSSQERLY